MGKKDGSINIKKVRTAFLALVVWAIASGGAYAVDFAPLQPAALEYTGTYALREIDPNLTGRGVRIAAVCRSLTYIGKQPQNDYRLNTAHDCFLDSSVSFVHGPGSGISSHSTAIGSILVGLDPNGFHPDAGTFWYEGASPEADLDVYEFWRFVSSYIFGPWQLDADILTMSVGTVFEDWWTRGIERLAERDGTIVVAGIGNGSDVYDPVLYPGASSNVIGVGVVDSVRSDRIGRGLSDFSLPYPEHSSCVPTVDLRCKPDLVAPGNCLVPDSNSLADYTVTGDWSSFAAPVVAGTVSLLVQKAKSDPSLALATPAEGGNSVIKAILMNSATKLPYWHKG
ncbi:MAG: S8 family serine peptidase, partial [Gammaproteobacteria bacterium]|nr:S8 family serine peptidase [Gammaproteobacteria bacterium]